MEAMAVQMRERAGSGPPQTVARVLAPTSRKTENAQAPSGLLGDVQSAVVSSKTTLAVEETVRKVGRTKAGGSEPEDRPARKEEGERKTGKKFVPGDPLARKK